MYVPEVKKIKTPVGKDDLLVLRFSLCDDRPKLTKLFDLSRHVRWVSCPQSECNERGVISKAATAKILGEDAVLCLACTS